ncbi:MAG: SUF system NifU family Fe-S cluster assembly protein [Nitrospiraceae bacterium]|nr:SUF system NifU family Fe-S cluster assembly protein [Nitrospiraceae bacterium]
MSRKGSHSGEAVEAWNADAVRADFPLLHSTRDGRPLLYLDSAATTQKPQAVIDAVGKFYATSNANVHRGLYALGEDATAQFEDVRVKAQRFLHAPTPEEIVFTRGTTDGINLVAQAFGRRFIGPGDEILITAMEHHSNLVPWQVLCRERGAVLRVAPLDETGRIEIGRFEELLSEKTKLAAFVHVSNVLGTINAIEQLVHLTHQAGAKALVDGAQSAGHIPVDVTALDCDFFACSGHKMLGPTGTGLLYGKAELLDAMLPYQSGGDMVLSVSFEETTYKNAPHKFEAGTPNVAGVVGLGAAIDYLNACGVERIAAHERTLAAHGTSLLNSVDGLRLLGPDGEKTPIWSFLIEGVHPHDAAQVLDDEGIAIRAGHHCAQPLVKHFGVLATARISLALYDTFEALETVTAALHKVHADVRGRCALYKDAIVEHSGNPRNFHDMPDATCQAEGHNTLCGDHLSVFLKLKDGAIADASFSGTGCVIARSAASLMTTELKGKTEESARALSEEFDRFIAEKPGAPVNTRLLGGLAALREIREYPVRTKCAKLAFHTMLEALARNNESTRAAVNAGALSTSAGLNMKVDG